MKLSKEFKIGVFSIIALSFLVIGFNYLLGINLFKKNREYVVFYENVKGLKPSNPITYRGVEVGLVKSIDFVGNNLDSVKVTIQIDHDQFLMKMKTQATLGSDGFLGGMKIDLAYGDTALQIAAVGDTLIPLIERDIQEAIGAEVAPLKKRAEELIGTIDSVITTITAFWDESTSEDISQSVAGVKRAIIQFEHTAIKLDTLIASERARLSRIFRNVESITENLSENNQNITNTMNNMSDFSNKLEGIDVQKTLNKAEETLGKLNLIVGQINSGEGTLGSLIYNDSLHTAILETNAYIKLLVDDIRNYPNRYLHFSIFGSREKGPVKLNSNEAKELKKLLDDPNSGEYRRFTTDEMDSLRNKLMK